MILTGMLIVLFIYVLVFRRRYRRAEMKELQPSVRLPLILCTSAAWAADTADRLAGTLGRGAQGMRGLRASDGRRRVQEALLITEKEAEAGRIRTAGLALSAVFAGLCLTFLLQAFGPGAERITEVERPAFGSEKTVEAEVDDAAFSFSVSGLDPSAEELAAVFDRTFEEVLPEILNGNPSFSEIRSSLGCPGEADNGIELSYESSDIEVLSGYGLIMAEEIPEEGLPVTFTVTLSYKGAEKAYPQAARVFGPAGSGSYLERLRAEIARRDSEGAGQAMLVLPETFEGESVAFWKPGSSPWAVLLLFVCTAAGLLVFPAEREKDRFRKRNEALETALPNLLLKLQLLIGAGLSIRSAVLKTAQDYEIEKAVGRTGTEYVYEELLRTAHELETGASETESYLRFGQRCGLRRYVKLGNLLAQSVRQGISGLEETLREETQSALEERKNRALRKGEEAGTKQLFPMILMLGVIIVILVTPTLLTF